jgi:hypothetical protein
MVPFSHKAHFFVRIIYRLSKGENKFLVTRKKEKPPLLERPERELLPCAAQFSGG